MRLPTSFVFCVLPVTVSALFIFGPNLSTFALPPSLDSVVNPALLLVAALTTGAVAFGENRRDGKRTLVGWITIAGCVLAFSLGLVKDHFDRANARALQAKVDQLLAEQRNLEKAVRAIAISKDHVEFHPRTNGSTSGEITGSVSTTPDVRLTSINVFVYTTQGRLVAQTKVGGDGNFELIIPFEMLHYGEEVYVLFTAPHKTDQRFGPFGLEGLVQITVLI